MINPTLGQSRCRQIPFHGNLAAARTRPSVSVSSPRMRAMKSEGRASADATPQRSAKIARVTWLLALGPAIEERIGELHVPVYLGDAMQWNLRQVGDARDVIVPVPDDTPLYVPAGFAEDQARFDY